MNIKTYNEFLAESAINETKSIDDSEARADWGWKPEFDLPKMTQVMIEGLKNKLGK